MCKISCSLYFGYQLKFVCPLLRLRRYAGQTTRLGVNIRNLSLTMHWFATWSTHNALSYRSLAWNEVYAILTLLLCYGLLISHTHIPQVWHLSITDGWLAAVWWRIWFMASWLGLVEAAVKLCIFPLLIVQMCWYLSWSRFYAQVGVGQYFQIAQLMHGVQCVTGTGAGMYGHLAYHARWRWRITFVQYAKWLHDLLPTISSDFWRLLL